MGTTESARAPTASFDPATWFGASFLLDESKLRPPGVHAGTVRRAAQIERLEGSAGVPVVSVVAPAGYAAAGSRRCATVPSWSVRVLLELVRTYLTLADTAAARVVLREAEDILRLRPELGNLPRDTRWLRATLDTMRAGAVGASSLTAAELRPLPLLSTHLTFREIGERLHVSRYTVKTQAISVYRKLGVSSRSEAIERVQAIGLLGA